MNRGLDRWLCNGWTDNLCQSWGEVWNETVQATIEMPPLGQSKTLLLPLPAARQSSNTHTQPCTADVCGSSNEAFFVPVSQGLGCSSAEMRPAMLSSRFWSSCVRSCSSVTSHRTDILANVRRHTILAASLFCRGWTHGVSSSAH